MFNQIRWLHPSYNVKILLTQCILLLHVINSTTYGNINCISMEGLKSGPNEGDLSSTQCPFSYSMTSCGIRTSSKSQKRIDGSFININNNTYKCNAMNSDSSPDGVYAVSRCCDFSPFDMQCNTYRSPQSTTNDEDIQSQSCQSSEELTGCTACTHNGNGTMDGAFPGTAIDYDTKHILMPTENICTAKVGTQALSGVHSMATCCSSINPNIQLQCKQIRGEASMATVGAISSVQCPNNYFMTGCSAYSHWIISNQWEIDANDTCIARTGAMINEKTTHSVAICCQLMVNTDVPTVSPTTVNPTVSPTTVNPTVSPSTMPTAIKAESEIDIHSTLTIETISDVDLDNDSQSSQFANIITIIVVLLLIICCVVTIICVIKSNYYSNKRDSQETQNSLAKEIEIDVNGQKELTVNDLVTYRSNKPPQINVNVNNEINEGHLVFSLPDRATAIIAINSASMASVEVDADSNASSGVMEGADTYSNAIALPMTPGCFFETSLNKIDNSILNCAAQAYPSDIETTKGDNDCLDESDKAYPEHATPMSVHVNVVNNDEDNKAYPQHVTPMGINIINNNNNNDGLNEDNKAYPEHIYTSNTPGDDNCSDEVDKAYPEHVHTPGDNDETVTPI